MHNTYKFQFIYNSMDQDDKHIKGFNWKEFFKIVIGIFLIFVGAGIAVTSNGKLSYLVIGFAFGAVGIGLLFTQ